MNQPPASVFVGVTGASGAPLRRASAARAGRGRLRALAVPLRCRRGGRRPRARARRRGARRGDGGGARRRRRRGARLCARRPRGAGGQRQQLPRRRRDLPVLDVVGRPHRAGHDADPHPPGGRGGAQRRAAPRARAPRDAALRDPPGAAARGAPRRAPSSCRPCRASTPCPAVSTTSSTSWPARCCRPSGSSSVWRRPGRVRSGERRAARARSPSVSRRCSIASCRTTTS